MAIIWQSVLDSDDFDLSHLEEKDFVELAEQLDTVVMAICQDWGVYQ